MPRVSDSPSTPGLPIDEAIGRARQSSRRRLLTGLVVAFFAFASVPVRAGQPENKALSVKPTTCEGWAHAAKARTVDLARSARARAFSEKNAAVAAFAPSQPGVFGESAVAPTLSCQRFNVAKVPSGPVVSAAVIVSLAATADAASTDVLVPSFSIDGGKNWSTQSAILLQGTIENAQHDGYWRFPLPSGLTDDDLRQLAFRLEYRGGETFTPVTIFVDGFALEVTVPREPGALRRLFNVSDQPVIIVDETSLESVELLDADGHTIEAPLEREIVDGKTRLTVRQGRALKPGAYILRTKSKGLFRSTVEEQSFSFGVASLNTPQAVYEPGDLVTLAASTLDDRGRTVCDAALSLRITKPDGSTVLLSTGDRSVVASAECGPDSLTNQPDYSGFLLADQQGTYRATLEVQTDQGVDRTEQTFEAQPVAPFRIERLAPTRINPKASYRVRLRITPQRDFQGFVEERLPASFSVKDSAPAASARTEDDEQILRWAVDWKAGETQEVSYVFDAPDVSPALYTLGPLSVGDQREPRLWTVSSDEVVRKEKADVTFESLAVEEADWDRERSALVAPTKTVFRAGENAHLKAFKRGYRLAPEGIPAPLDRGRSLSVTTVDVIGPDNTPIGATRVSESFRRAGQELEILHLVPGRTFRPGVYRVVTTVSDGQTTATEEQAFAWGVLVINTRKSVSLPGETVEVGLSALDAGGKTVCDADLTMTVQPPAGPPIVLTTDGGGIERSATCGPITVTNTPDYQTTLLAGITGDYAVTVTATVKGQSYTITDTLAVRPSVAFVIERQAPTRVFPPAQYDLGFTVTPSADYQGTFEEFIPSTYAVVSVGQGGISEASGSDAMVLRWTVDWQAGQTYALSYRVDPEDVSPAIFRLGPAKVGDFTEFRQWQIASDALITVSGTVYTNEGTTAYDCSATNLTINVRVNGGGTASATCTAANGTYSVGSVSVSAAADVITTYVDANASFRAVAVSRTADATSNITNLDLYQNRVITRHEDAGPTTNTNLDQFDSGNDADIQFTVTTGALTVASGQELHVWTGKSYSPGGTITTNTTGGDVHVASSATLTAGGNLSVGGSWNNQGTFTAGTNTVTFAATSSGKTVSGTLNGSSAFYKVAFNGSGGEWTITDSMLVSAASATDTFVVGNGTVTFGDGNGDALEIDGKTTIANTANQTGTLQTAAVAEASTITVDINNNAAPATCANCIVTVGATSGSGTGSLKIRKNTLFRLNPRNTATVSDTGIEVESTGYLEVKGSQDVTGTSNSTTDETTITDTTKNWTTNEHVNKVVRITNSDSLAFGRVYAVTANAATTLTRADTSSATATVQSIVSDETYIKTVCANSNALITANDEGIGRYIYDSTGTTGHLLIVDSVNNAAACTGSTDQFVLYNIPNALSILAASDTFELTDGVRQNDTYEILDYASLTAENGTSCNATINQSGEAYVSAKAGSETVIQYAEVCNLGRNASNLYGVLFTSVNGSNSNEGLLVDKSNVHHNYVLLLNGTSNNSAANSEGVTSSLVHDHTTYGIQTSSADTLYFASNRIYDNTSYGIFSGSSSDSATITGNHVYSNSSLGIYLRDTNHSVTSNYVYENVNQNIYACCSGRTMTISSNTIFGATGSGYGIFNDGANSQTISSNTIVRNAYGIRLQNATNSVVSSNTFVGNTGYGIFLSNSADNTVINSNTVFDNGARGLNIQNTVGVTAFSNTFFNNDTQISGGYGLYFESNAGSGTDSNTFFNNDLNGEDTAMFIQYSVAGTGNRFINEEYGVTSTNTFDLSVDSAGGHQFELYNTTLNSSNEFNGSVSGTSSYVISRKHDGTNGAVRVWNDYAIPGNNAETPQTESTEQYNYANGLWPDSITPHTYKVGYGAGTEDTDIQLAVSGAMGGDTGVYAYRVVCNAANCVTTGSSWDVYRNETLLTAKGSTATTYTDSQVDGASAPNVQFTIGDAGTDYSAGATYTFVAWKGATDTNTQKTVKMMQNADTFTAGSGTTLQLKGQSAGANVTQVQRNTTGGYSFIIGGTIDADAYSFNHLGGTAQASGLDINSGATITSLDNGSFDNFATNVGTADSFIDIDSSIISTGTPSNVFDAISFVNTGSNANCNINATGADAAGYIQVTGTTGAFGGETNDCNDGVADGDPGQIKWGGIRVKGTVYSDEGSTAYNCSTDNLTLNVSVNGGANTSYTCTSATGAYTFAAGAPSAGADPIVLSIDSAETPKATTATLASSTTAPLASFDLYQNRLIVRHEDSGPMTNAKLSTGDNADAGIRYAVSGGNLTVESGIELHVGAGETFTPGGTVTTQAADLHIPSTATFNAGGNAVTVGGGWTNAGTYTPGSNTTTFNASSGTKTINSTGAASAAFNNLTLNDGGGGATFLLGSVLDVDGDLTNTSGTLDVASGSNYQISVGGNWANSGTFTPRSGLVLFDATDTGNTINAGSSSFNMILLIGTGGSWSPLTNTLTITSSLTVTDGTLDTSAGSANVSVGSVTCSGTCGTINLTATGHTFTQSVTANASFGSGAGSNTWTFYNLTLTSTSGSPTITFVSGGTGSISVLNNFATSTSGTALTVDNNTNDRTLDVDNDVTIGANTTFQTSSSASFTVGGSVTNSGTFTHNSGTVTLDSSAATETIDGGSSAFSNLTINNGLAGYWKMDDGTSTAFADASGNGYTGTLTDANANSAWTTSVNNSAHYGNNPAAFDFNGDADFVDVGNQSQLRSMSTLTVSAWFNPDTTGTSRTIVGNWGNTTPVDSRKFLLRYNNTDLQGYVFANSLQVGGTFFTSSYTGGWHHVAMTWDGTTLRMYVDGSVSGTTFTGSGSISGTSQDSMYIGDDVGTSGNPFDGKIDDVRVYRRALAAGEITELNAGTHPTTATYTLQRALDVDGNLSVRTGKLDVSATNCSGAPCGVTVGGSYTNVSGLELRTGTVTFDGGATGKTIQADMPFYNFSVTGSGGGWTLDKQRLDVNNTLTLSNGTLDASASGCSGAVSCAVTVGNNWTNSGGTFTARTGTVTLDATDVDNTVNAGASSFYNLTLNGSGAEWSPLTNTLAVSNDLTVTNGTLNNSDGSANVTVNGNAQCGATCGTITLTTGTFTQSVSANKSFGTNIAVATDWTFYNLTFTGASGVRTITINGTGTGEMNVTNNLALTNSGTSLAVDNNTNDRVFDVDNDVSIGAGATFSASNSATFSIGGSWSNSGTFTHNSGTVVFDSIQTTETITSGGSAFGNLEIDSGLVGYWKLDEGTGTSSVVDSSRYGQAGTMVNHEAGDWNTSVESATDFGNDPYALDLDGTATGGSEEYINLGTPTQLNEGLTTQLTLVANVRPAASAKLEVIIGKPHNDAKSAPYYKWLLYRTSNNALSCRIGDQFKDSVASTLVNDSWSSAGCVYDSSNITIYHQGSSIGTQPQSDPIESSSTPAAIGAGTGTTITEEFTGRIDDVRIYKRALSSTEMTALHNGAHPATATFTLQDAMDVDGNLGLRTGELDVSATNCSLSPCGLTVGGNYVNVANLNARTGTVTLDSSDAANIQADEAFYNATISNGGTRTLDKQRLDVDNDLTITAGTLDVSAASCSGGASCSVDVGGNFKNWGTFASQTGTVTMNAPSGTKTIDTSEADSAAGADFTNLTLNDSGGSATFKPVYNLDVNGNLAVTGGTLDMSGPTTWYLTNDGGGTVNQRLMKSTDPAGSADNTSSCSDDGILQSGYCILLPRGSNLAWVSQPSTIQQRGWMFNDGLATTASIASGTWSANVTTVYSEGTYSYTTRRICGRVWKASTALTSETALTNWACTAIATGTNDYTISWGSLSAKSLSNEVLYVEFALNVSAGVENASGSTTLTFRVNEGGSKQKLNTPAFTPSALIGGNWTNNDTFTHASGTVLLDGSSQQTVGAGATSFSGLTVTNNSGTDPDSSPSVIFSGDATAAGTFTAATANAKLRFNAGSTYTFQNISFNGQATGTRTHLRSSSTGTQWNLNVAGTRSVSNTNVRDSNACGQSPDIDASDGTNFDAGNNSCWSVNTLTFAVSDASIGFGSLSSSAARWASGDGTGSATDVAAHTLQIATNATNGYAITYNGATLTSGSNTISAATITDDADGTSGSEQFAMGFSTTGNATIASGYDHNATASLRDWNFVPATTTTIVSESGATTTETVSAFYLTNIVNVTEAGAYTTTLTYIATATF